MQLAQHTTNQSSRLQAVLLDWAGTTIDHGSRAPTEVFVEIFRRSGIEVAPDEARAPMGMAKRDHIAAITTMPRVAEAWEAHHGRSPTADDVQRMYEDFLPLQKEILGRGVDVIAGVPEVVDECRARGLKIGSTTGYTRELMEVVAPLAAQKGYSPEAIVCPDETRSGRPAPWLNFRAAEHLDVYPMSTIVVVDDTLVGIDAGLHAGAWTVAVSQTGNALGLSEADVQALDPDELQSRLEAITDTFRQRGAHFVIPSVADLLPILDEIGERVEAGC